MCTQTLPTILSISGGISALLFGSWWMSYTVDWIYAHWEFLVQVPILGILWGVFRRLLSKPQIVIKEVSTIGFNPCRSIWEIQIMNQKLKHWQEQLFKRNNLEDCWIQADFVVGVDIPFIGNKIAVAYWGKNIPNKITLKPTSTAYEIELISKIYGEVGFHIKEPIPETLMTAEDSLVCVFVKTGEDETINRAIWAISYRGTNEELDFERLE